MKKIEELTVKYLGYSKPEKLEEAELEILGLVTAINSAQQRIDLIKQRLKLQELLEGAVNEKTVEANIDTEKAE